MRNILFIVLAMTSYLSQAQNANVYTNTENQTIVIYADNNEPVPITIDLDLDMQNMVSDFGGESKRFLIPPQSKKHKMTVVSAGRGRGNMSVDYHVSIQYGDVDKAKRESDYIYALPFAEGISFEMIQGYHGSFSHHHEKALDFNMEEGNQVHAARGGTVIKVEERNNRSCADRSCNKFNNYITIYHDDGTFADYVHLKVNGALVNVGDKVEQGQHIGYSGKTGWTTGPHLHFIVYRQEIQKRISIATKFATSESSAEYLVEGKVYSK